MARKNIRVGLIGVGAAAQINHIPALKRTEGLELVGLYDRDPEKASRVAERSCGCVRLTKWRQHSLQPAP